MNILDALSEVMDIFIFEMRREILRTEKRKGMLQEAHKQIVECLLKRDVVNGQKALMKHFDMIDNIIHKFFNKELRKMKDFILKMQEEKRKMSNSTLQK